MIDKQDYAILIVGGDGNIGRSLAAHFSKQNLKVIKTSRRKPGSQQYWPLDLSEATPAYQLPKNIAVAFICAGMASIEQCRLHPDETRIVNVQQTEILCKQIVASGGRIVFLSSNVVYDGSLPYRKEIEPVCPTTEYGCQKAEAEKRLLALGKNVTIVRLTKVITQQIPLFAEWIGLLKKGIAIHPRHDMVLSPLSLNFVVDVLGRLKETAYSGILQLSGAKEITYATLAQEIARQLGVSLDLIQPIDDTKTTELHGSKQIQNTTLDTTMLNKLFKLETPSCENVVASMLNEKILL